MIAHHHLDGRRIIRLLILIWTLLLLLVLLPIRAHGQESLETPISVELIEEPTGEPTQVGTLLAAENLLLVLAGIAYLVTRTKFNNDRRRRHRLPGE
jgi:hypothetical protein